MADDFDEIVSTFKRRHNDVLAADALVYAVEIHRELVADLGIKKDEKTINLVAGTWKYALGNEAMRVLYVFYYTDADTFHKLTETTRDRIEYDDEDWSQQTFRTTPIEYLIEQPDDGSKSARSEIWLTPVPATTTSGVTGYPLLKVGIAENEAPVGATKWPPVLLSKRVYIEGMNWLYSKDYQDLDVQEKAEKIYRHEIDRNRRHIKRMTPKLRTVLRPRVALGRRVV